MPQIQTARERTWTTAGTFSSTILWITVALLLLASTTVATTILTSDVRLVRFLLRVPIALFTLWLALVEWYISLRIARCFAPETPLRRAWILIAGAGGVDVVSVLSGQILGVPSRINPLQLVQGASETLIPTFRQVGLTMGGPLRFALLAAGLYFTLVAYRRAGLLGRLKQIDAAVLGGMACYVFLEMHGLLVEVAGGRRPGIAEIMHLPVDPLLGLLLVEALLLYRSLRRTGMGLIGRCWAAFAAAILLTVLGDVGLWLRTHGLIVWPWASLTWLPWLPAAAAFTLGPVFQWEAISTATTSSRREDL